MEGEMTFLEHLEDLRRCLLISLGSVAVITMLAFFAFRYPLFEWLVAPARDLHSLTPTETILTQIKISIIAGIFIAFPVVAWQIWRFVSPGLYRSERKYLKYFVVFAWIFFVSGGLFARYVMLPFCVSFFRTLTEDSNPYVRDSDRLSMEAFEALDLEAVEEAWLAGEFIILEVDGKRLRLKPPTLLGSMLALIEIHDAGVPVAERPVSTNIQYTWSISSFVSLSFWMLLVFGIVFDLPVAVSLLTMLGIVNHRFLGKNRKYALIIIMIVSAVFTPADVFTMMIMACPLYVLYEVSIIASWWFGRRRQKKLALAGLDAQD